MNLKDVIWFFGTFIIVYLFYFFFQVYKKPKLNPQKVPVELLYLQKKYHLDLKKIKYRGIMQIIAIVSSLDIAITATFVMKFVKNIYLAIIIGAIILIPLIIITFNYIGIYYVRKGMIKNGNQKNRK